METRTHRPDEAEARTGERPSRRPSQPGSTALGQRSQLAGSPSGRAGITAGMALLLMIVPAMLGNFVVVEGLVTAGDAARTAADIMASEGLFRVGVASLLVVVLLDVVVAWALYRFFQPVAAGLSALAAAFRLVYAGVFTVAIARLAAVPGLLGDDALIAAVGREQVEAQAMLAIGAYHDIWSAGILLFGVHLLVLGYLAYRSGFVPKVLGVLIAIAGFGYVFDSLAAALVGDGAPVIAGFTFLGEVLLAVWLVVWSRRQRCELRRAAEVDG